MMKLKTVNILNSKLHLPKAVQIYFIRKQKVGY
jgi:hypothetical protein